MAHVAILCPIQVYRFFVMCQGIMNSHVYIDAFQCRAEWSKWIVTGL